MEKQNEKAVEVVEDNNEVEVVETGIGKKIKAKLAAVPEALKKPKTLVIGGIAAATGVAGLVALEISRRREVAKIESELESNGLTIEDVPELQAELEAEYGVVS